jgi:hypothetical protein
LIFVCYSDGDQNVPKCQLNIKLTFQRFTRHSGEGGRGKRTLSAVVYCECSYAKNAV